MAEKDLIPMNQRTLEEQKKIARLGGIASGEARRRKKTLKQIGDMIGELPLKNKDGIKILKDAGIDESEAINDVAMIYRLYLKARSGDVRAIELLAKLRGQLKEQVQAEVVQFTPLIDLTDRSKNNGGEKAAKN